VVRAGVMLALVALVAADRSGLDFFLVVLVALSVNRFMLAALSAALPHVVDEDRLVMANSVTPTAGTFAFLLGLAAGGGVREAVDRFDGYGDLAVLGSAALLYAVAGALAGRIGRTLLGPDFDPSMPTVREHVRHILVGLVDGFHHLRERREAADGLLAIGSHRFFYGISTVATILLYRSYFNPPGQPEAGFQGLAVAVLVSGAGFVAAALVTPLATSRLALQQWVTALLVLAAVVQVLPGAFYTEPTMLVAAFVLGLVSQGVKISVDTLVQEWVDDAFRGRVFSFYDVIFNVAFVAAAAVGAFILPDDGRSYAALALIALGYAVTAVVYWRIHTRSLRRSAQEL
jgi:hypothetical protein